MDRRTVPCGDCFRWAVFDAAEHGGVVVHGVVTEYLSRPPKRYEHGWVERDGRVYDWQTMEAGHGGQFRGVGYPRRLFYDMFAPQKTVEYDAGEAVGMAAKTGHYGPWDPKVARNPESGVSEAPGIHELEDGGGVTLRYRVPSDRPQTPTARDIWLRKHPFYDEYMGEYYTWDPSLSIEEILERWQKYGAKAYSNVSDSFQLPTGEYFEAIYPIDALWEYRRDDRPVNPALAKGLEEHGWLAPLLIKVGKNGCVEIGEGNHRIRIAHEKGLQYVPVRFWFVQEAPCVSDEERRERAEGYERARMLEERERDVVPGAIKFYTQERELKFNRASSMKKVTDEFNRAFDVVARHFPDFGDVELHEDERAGADNGAGADRQFAYCMEGDPIVIAFAPKAAELPKSHLKGLMRHEFGHALEYRYGVKELQKRLKRRLPEKVERRADVIAETVWNEPIVYDSRDIQCVGVHGKKRRPRRLPDRKEKLRPNARNRTKWLPESLPEWAKPNESQLKRLHEKAKGEGPKDWLDCLDDSEIEEALFGFSSMRGTITLDTDEIEWNDSNEGPYESLVEQVEEEGPEYYDTMTPIIVDLTWAGTFELNDGHHRYVANREFGDDHSMRAEVQIPPGLAREWARKLIASMS